MNGDPAGFDPARAQLLEQLAEIALQDLGQPVFLPPGWDVVQFVAGTRSGSIPSAQGFYAKGDLDGTGSEVAVLALGVRWQEYLDKTQSGGILVQDAPPAGVVSGAPHATFEVTLSAIYSKVRAAVWQKLAQGLAEGNGTLVVAGKGLGGPLAQLAALDLRPGNKGPANESPPAAVSPCYAFSTPAAGNTDFAAYYAGIVTDSPVFGAGPSDLPVDFFPRAPTPPDWVLPGTPVALDASLPTYDDPWQERSGNLYLRALGGIPEPPPVAPGRVRNPPDGFERAAAFTFAQFCSIAYLAAQHPMTSSGINIAPYQVVGQVTSRGTPLCTLFASPDAVVAAFRGSTTWAEFQEWEADTLMQLPDFLPDNTAMVLGGALRPYTAAVSSTDATPFRTALLAQLTTLAAGKPVYLAGHALGGALANLAAVDLRSNAPGTTLRKVYTFGANTLGSYSFAQFFATTMGSDAYQVARPGDFAPSLLLGSGYEPLGTQVILDGTPPDDDFTQHTLTGYIQLLDPRGAQSREPVITLSAGERARFRALLAGTPGAGASGERRGVLVLGAEAPRDAEDAESSDAPEQAEPERHPRTGLPVHAFETMRIPDGARLTVRTADGGPAHLVVGALAAGAGANLSLETGGTVEVMRASAADVLTLSFVGRDGVNGASGPPGSDGASGTGNNPGAAGGRGERGQDGEAGMDALDTELHLGDVQGGLEVYARGGNGGNGGNGGRGGAGGSGGPQGGSGGPGGPGGPGGNGGDAGNGARVTLYVRSVPPSSVHVSTPASTGGAGGAGGAGGPGGSGVNPGPSGPPGYGGAPGIPSVVNVIVGGAPAEPPAPPAQSEGA